ncbi:MAG: NRDE family protein, partial [Acidobacteriota bacterium]|nr:NRDE family protein [Acidobacteriota bacterium]
MCTATWLFEDDGYQLLFNRDESRARGRGEPARQFRAGDAIALAPRDSDFGGSWIGVNAGGVSLCILNRYEDDAMHEDGNAFSSRGLLLVSL